MTRLAPLIVTIATVLAFTGCAPGRSNADAVAQQPNAQLSEQQNLYAQHCAECHGPNLEGGSGPSLVGPRFQKGFETGFDLFKYVESAMPMNSPKSLSETEYLKIIELILVKRGVQFAEPLTRTGTIQIALVEEGEVAAVPTIPHAPLAIGTPPPLSAVVAATAAPTPQSGASRNRPPARPKLIEPTAGPDGDISPYFLWFQTSEFEDSNAGDSLTGTEYEIWDASADRLAWRATVDGDRSATQLNMGRFVGPLKDRLGLLMDRAYKMRARVRDSSGDAAGEWSPWSPWVNHFVARPATGERPSAHRLRLMDIASGSLRLTGPDGAPIELPTGQAKPPTIEILNGGHTYYTISGQAEPGNRETDFDSQARYGSVFLRISSGDAEVLPVPDSTISFTNELGAEVRIHLPGLALGGNQTVLLGVAGNGSTYWEADTALDAGEGAEPSLRTAARHTPEPWLAAPGFAVERVATGLLFPIHLAFVPDPGPDPDDPVGYITELRGQIMVLKRSGELALFADELLNFNPDAPPVSLAGENGVSGIAVDPASGDLLASLVFEMDGELFNEIIRIKPDDGGLKAGNIESLLQMVRNPTTASHQVHALTIGSDGTLYANVGNAFNADHSQSTDSFNGKIIRLALDGSAPEDNPFYDPDRPSHPTSYIFAIGIRNAFGSTWRFQDDRLYISENGDLLDRIVRVEPGQNLGYDGTDASMVPDALYVFGPPSVTPTGIDVLDSGGPFPADLQGRVFVATSGRNFVRGSQSRGKRIWVFDLTNSGEIAGPPAELMAYAGDGRSSISGLAFGPDGLYFLDLFPEYPPAGNPFDRSSSIWRVVYKGE